MATVSILANQDLSCFRMASAIDFTNNSQKVNTKENKRPKSAVYKTTSTFENLFGVVEVKHHKPTEATLFQRVQSESRPRHRDCRPLSVCPLTGRLVGATSLEVRALERRPGQRSEVRRRQGVISPLFQLGCRLDSVTAPSGRQRHAGQLRVHLVKILHQV